MSHEQTLFVYVPELKSGREYKNKYCHPRMHEKNYPIRCQIRVPTEFLDRLEARDFEALNEMEENLRGRSIQGEAIIVKVLGGPGRRARGESKEHWRAKRQSGMPEVVRIWV